MYNTQKKQLKDTKLFWLYYIRKNDKEYIWFQLQSLAAKYTGIHTYYANF